MPTPEITVGYVFLVSLVTAIFTGMGVVPFLFVSSIDKKFIGFGNSIAAGLMMGASIGLVQEAYHVDAFKMVAGFVMGMGLVVVIRWLLPGDSEGTEQKLSALSRGNFRKVVMIMCVMTAHSFAEGVGVGVSFGGREGLGNLISAAIAIHNIPEGVAIALVLIPRGFSRLQACLLSIVSSLPQPLMAVPAFLFVLVFQPFLPIGLGFAAGAMIYMVFFELLPDALENTDLWAALTLGTVSTLAMLTFQWML